MSIFFLGKIVPKTLFSLCLKKFTGKNLSNALLIESWMSKMFLPC